MVLTAEQKKKAADVFGLSTEQVDDLPLDRPNIKAVMSIEIRMSGVWQCMRRLGYEAFGTEPSDEIPTRNANIMASGNYLEPLVKDLMRRDGWEVDDHNAVMIPHGRVTLTGHPDAIGRHQHLTGDSPVVIEVKTRSESAAQYAWDIGVERTHPESVQQAALYSVALYGKPQDIFVSTLARDSMEYRTERIPADRVEFWFGKAMARVNEIADMVFKGELPEPEVPAGDYKCQSCPFRTMCGNAELPEMPGESGLTESEIETTLREWINASAKVPKTSSPESKAKKAAADTLKNHMIAVGDFERELEIDGQVYRMKRSESDKVNIDFDAFNELVEPEIREQVVVSSTSNSLRITPIKPKKASAKKGDSETDITKKPDGKLAGNSDTKSAGKDNEDSQPEGTQPEDSQPQLVGASVN